MQLCVSTPWLDTVGLLSQKPSSQTNQSETLPFGAAGVLFHKDSRVEVAVCGIKVLHVDYT